MPMEEEESEGRGVLLDSLPYVDSSYEAQEEAVLQLIEAEMNTFQPPNYLSKYARDTVTFESNPLLQQELERVSQQQPIPPLDTSRYALAPPPLNRTKQIEAWEEAINNAKSQLEHQSLRIANLELMQKYGANLWRSYITQLEGLQRELEAAVTHINSEIEEINVQRKSEQLECGEKLAHLESKRLYLIRKNHEIEAVCRKLEQEGSGGSLEQ